MQGINLTILNKADRWISKYGIHRAGAPVSVKPLLEQYQICYDALPRAVEAMTIRWKHWQYVGMSFNERLLEPSESAEQRYVQAHELVHVLLRHRGDFWVLWSCDNYTKTFDIILEDIQERQCDLLAAYLLIPFPELYALRNEGHSYSARALDVPQHLVELRWSIWGKFGR